MFPIINTCLKTYLEYVTQYVQANACIRSKRALCKLEGRMHDRGCNFFLSGVHGCVSIVYWMQVWILVGSMDLAGPVATLFLAASFIRTQQLGRCTLSRTVGPPLHICACRNHLRTTQASMLHGVEWICLIFDSLFFFCNDAI